jgi:hypothetical protein
MRVMVEVLPPGMEHRDGADLGTQMLGIGGDQVQGLGHRLEQQAVDKLLVMESDLANWRRQGEHEVEIGHRQQLGLALGQPLGGRRRLTLRTVPVAAGIIGDADLAAALTLLDMAPQSGRAASFDGGHHPPLGAAEMTGMGLAISGTMVAEDIRHLECRAHAGGLSRMTSVADAAGRAGWRWPR